MSDGIIGLGTTMTVTDGASNAAAAFVMLRSFTAPAPEQEYADGTYLNQGNRYKRKVPALIELGDVSFTLLYIKADYARCVALQGVSKTYVVTYPDSSTHTMTLSLSKCEMEVTADGIQEIKCTAKQLAVSVFAAAA